MRPLTPEDRSELAGAVGRLLREHVPLERARQPYDGDADALDLKAWQHLAQTLGVVTLQAPEDDGGQGCSIADVAVVATELGAVLARTPFVWSTGVVVSTLTRLAESGSGTAHASALLRRLAAGQTATTSLTHPLEVDAFTVSGSSVPKETMHAGADDSARVTGEALRVPWAGEVDVLLVMATEGGSPVLLAVDTSTPGLVRVGRMALDRTVPLSDVHADGAEALVLARGAAAVDAAQYGVDCGAVLLAAEMVGAARAMLERTVRYAREREQFGKPIGAQQAIKHQLAQVAAELELARAAVVVAVEQLDGGGGRLPAVATAKALASDMFLTAADTCLHVHGGMGFTWEQDSHVFLRRARFVSGAFGDARLHRSAFLAALLDDGPG
jgi:alkylation response protein AidB-like acyl-CoA dehydrogenase